MKITDEKRELKLIQRVQPKEIVVATLCVFLQKGKEEVSLSELQESVAEFQKEFPLGYSFSGRFLYSPGLASNLEDLQRLGYIRKYTYRHDAFLPKRFLALTMLGRGHGTKVLKGFPEGVIQVLQSATEKAIKSYEETWRLWSRQK